MTGPMLVAEVAEALAQHGRLRCAPTVATGDDGVVLTLAVPVEGQDDTVREALNLLHTLQWLQDLAQLRELAARYDIDPAKLEQLLPAR